MSVLRRTGTRPRTRRARSRRGPPLPAVNDLRARIAAIVERDRARERSIPGSVTDRNPLNAVGSPRSGDRLPTSRGPSVGDAASAHGPFTVHEARVAVDKLGLEGVARGAVGPLRAALRALKGGPARGRQAL